METCPGGIGKHVQHIIFGTGGVFRHLVQAGFRPFRLPLRLYFGKIDLHYGKIRKAANYQNARQLPYFRLQTILPPYASNIVVHDSQKAVSDAPLRVVFPACSEVDPSLGIERYYGDYSGLALRTYKHLDATNSFFITEYSDWDYFMTVSEDTTENCLNLIVVYNDTTIASLGSVLIDDTGFGETQSGKFDLQTEPTTT